MERSRSPKQPLVPTRLPGGRRAHLALAVAIGAGLTALASPAIGFSPAALLALAPLVWATTQAASWRGALAVGVAASAATTALVFHWLPGSLHEFFAFPTAASWAVFPAYAALAQPQLIVWAVARWRLRARRGVAVMVASAALYAGLDWALPKLFQDTLGVSFYADLWVIQIAELGGLAPLTFAAVLVGEVVCAVGLERRREIEAALVAAAVWAAILLYGAVRLAQLEAVQAKAPVLVAGVAQANIGNIEKEIALRGDLEGIVETLITYGKLSDELVTKPPAGLRKPDLVVWPETAYPLAFGAHRSKVDDEMDEQLVTWARERDTPLLFGGYRRTGATEYNAAVLLEPSGAVAAYHKFHLIPLGEYIPLLGRARFGTGGTPRVLEAPLAGGQRARLAPVICYESLLPRHAAAAVRAGAQALVNLTNDSWFVSTAEKKLHLAMAAVRSVETRRAQLRATNTGFSALILPTGELRNRGPEDVRVALRYDVPLLDLAPTLSTRFGTWAGPACLVLAVLAVLLRRRNGRAPGATSAHLR